MSEKKYLLTESDISKIGQLECESCAANAAGRFDCSEALDADRHRMLESHEYRERTYKPIRRGTIISCGACGSELHEPFRFCGGCGSRVVEP